MSGKNSGDCVMTAKKLALAAALLLGTSLGLSTASLAQTYYGPGYHGYYDYAPGYHRYGRYSYGAGSDCDRGGSGPRVGCGSGMGIGAER
jgi:hypothetical protein